MKWILAVALLATALPGVDTLRAEDSPGENALNSSAAQAATEKAVYVDVRSPEEFASGHVKGAINIPHDQMQQRWKELAEHKTSRLVVYCRSGRRSAIAIDVLKENGFQKLENGGGYEKLAADGVPTSKEEKK